MDHSLLKPQQDTTTRLVTALAKIGGALRSETWKDAGPRGLTPTQGQILTFLANGRGHRLTDVAAALGVTNATASDAVRTLESKGLVTKTRDANDARTLQLRLTPEGTDLAARTAAWPDAVLEVLEDLNLEEQAALLRSLVRVIRGLQVRGRIAPQRLCVTCTHFRPNAHLDPERPHHCAFVDTAFGDASLRLDCLDHSQVAASSGDELWQRFLRASA